MVGGPVLMASPINGTVRIDPWHGLGEVAHLIGKSVDLLIKLAPFFTHLLCCSCL
jgi:hypothetical protein